MIGYTYPKVYLLFTAETCRYCPEMKKRVGSFNLGHFEIDVNAPLGRKIAQEYHVHSLPTFIISAGLEPTTEIDRVSGLVTTEFLDNMIHKS